MNEKNVQHPTNGSQKECVRVSLTDRSSERVMTANVVPLHSNIHWFLNIWKPLNPHHRNIAALFKVTDQLSLVLLEKTMKYLLWHHDVLRSRFFQESGIWQHVILQPNEIDVAVTEIDLSACAETEHKTTIEAIIQEAHLSIHLSNGPLFRIVYINLGQHKTGLLLLVIHHLLIDGYSMEILLNDFATVYTQLRKGESARLPPKTDPFQQWTERLHKYAQSPERRQEMEYWLTLPWHKVVPFPLDYPYIEQLDTIASSNHVRDALSTEDTTMLVKCTRAPKTELMNILLTALVQTFAWWTGSPLLHVGVANHARLLFDDLNTSRTVGFVATSQDILLNLEGTSSIKEMLLAVKQQRATFPFKGFGKEILSRISKDPAILKSLQAIPRRQLLFNYQGHYVPRNSHLSFIEAAEETTVSEQQDPQNRRLEVLYWSCIIVHNQFHFTIEYSENMYKQTTMKTLTYCFKEALQRIMANLSQTL